MLETDFTWWTYVAWIIIGIFAVVALLTIVAGKRLIAGVIVGVIGLALAGFIRGFSGDEYFDIAVIKDVDGTVSGELFGDEVGGVYTYSNSTSVMLRRGENEPGTFIINDSPQYAFIAKVHYIATGVSESSVPPDEVLVVVGPGETRYVTYNVNYVSSLESEPPVEIDITEGVSYESRHWLTWADFEPALGPY